MKDWNGVTKIVNDALGRAVSVIDADGQKISYKWGSMGEKEELIYPNGEKASYYYNEKGQLSEVVTGQGRTVYGYDQVGRLLNQLILVMKDGKLLREYEYDGFGNRVAKLDYNTDIEKIVYTYNQKNQLTEEVSGKNVKQYEYDHRGNLINVLQDKQLQKRFVFGAQNVMERVDELHGTINRQMTFNYNGFGNKIGQLISKGEERQQDIRFVVDPTRQYYNLLSQEDLMNENNSIYYWDKNVLSMQSQGEESYFIHDDLGSPMHILSETGGSREQYGFRFLAEKIEDSGDIYQCVFS